MNIDFLWIKHPRSKKADTMLTFSVWALLTALYKFTVNGSIITVGDWSYNFGTTDATLIAAILGATLVAYVSRKWKDSPDKENSDESS